MNKQKLVLIVLLAILALALLYAFWATPRQRRVAVTERAPRERPAASAPERDRDGDREGEEDEAARVRLELLDRESPEFQGVERDIFHFPVTRRPPPVVKAPPPPPTPEPPPVAPPPLPEARPLEPAELRRQLARFKFLGYLLQGSTRTIFLESGEEIFVVKRGERFGEENEFLVTGLTPETLTIRQKGEDRPIVVPLVEQAPLIPRGAAPPTPAGLPRSQAKGEDPIGVLPGLGGEPDQGREQEEMAPHPLPEGWGNGLPTEPGTDRVPGEAR